jgi:Rieske Fe-S protein
MPDDVEYSMPPDEKDYPPAPVPTDDFDVSEGDVVDDPEFGSGCFVHRITPCFIAPLYHVKIYDGNQVHTLRREAKIVRQMMSST